MVASYLLHLTYFEKCLEAKEDNIDLKDAVKNLFVNLFLFLSKKK